MLYIRVVFFALSLVVAAISGFCFFSSDSDHQLLRAREHFLQDEYSAAGGILQKLEGRVPFAELCLYKAYIAREEGEMDEADRYLQEALSRPVEGGDLTLQVELYLNQMLNAYLRRDAQDLSFVLEKFISLTNERLGWIALFSSLEAYLNKEYRQAAMVAQQSLDRSYLSPWMEKVFQEMFPSDWISMFLARCEIARGNLIAARQKLEEMAAKSLPEEQVQINFLLGLSYIREAEAKTYHAAISDYKLALQYFDQVPLGELRFHEDVEQVLIAIRKNVNEAVEAKSYEELLFYGVILEKWGDREDVEKLETDLVQILEEKVEAGQWEQVAGVAFVLNEILDEGPVREALCLRLETLMQEALENGDSENLENYWATFSLLSSEPEDSTQRLSDQVLQKLLSVVQDDDGSLTSTTPYLGFWGQVEKDHNRRYQLAQKLLVLAEDMWHRPGEREKAIRLMKEAQSLPVQTQKHFVRVNLEKKFREFFLMAYQEDNVVELDDIYEAIQKLELADVEVHNSQDKTSILREAQQLYANQRYEESKKKALWLYKLDPQNEEARSLLGKIAYREGEYQQAYSYFKDLEVADPSTLEAQAASYIFVGEVKAGRELLEKASQKRPINDETYLRLGFGLLVLDKPIAALQWFEEVSANKPEVLAGRCFASFAMQSWEEALGIFRKLPAPYSALDGYHGIAIESLMALGEESEAEEMLNTLLRSSPQPDDSKFPLYFQVFKRKKLDQWSRYLVAALFYKAVKKDPEQALEYLYKIQDPTPYDEIEKAELLIHFGRNYEAKKLLLRLVGKVQGFEKEKLVKLRLLPLLGAVYTKQGFFVEALPYYKEFYFLEPEDNAHRADYAKVLMKLQRFDLALDQYRLLKRSYGLKPLGMLSYIQSLIQTDQFELANKTAWKWLADIKVPFIYQIQLARMMVITKNQELLDGIVQTLSTQGKRTSEENRQLIRLWAEMANYDDAQSLADISERELEDTPEGLMVLADLYAQLSRFDKAMDFAERASELAPTSLSIASFLERYERSPEVIAKSVKLLKEKIEHEPESTTLKLDYAADLLDLAVESYSSGEVEDIRQSFDLQQARDILEKIIEKNKEIPGAYYLLGKVYYLLGEDSQAKTAYQTALRLDVSYVKAYQHLALIHEGSSDVKMAIALLRKASKFAPNSSEIWEQLAGLLLQEGNTAGAMDALKRAIRFTPNEASPFIKMAEIHLQQKAPEEAVSTLRYALELSPKDMEGIKLMLIALHDPGYRAAEEDLDGLKNLQLRYFDKLQALDPQEADAMRDRLGVEAE